MLRNPIRVGLLAVAALVLVVASWHPNNFGLSEGLRRHYFASGFAYGSCEIGGGTISISIPPYYLFIVAAAMLTAALVGVALLLIRWQLRSNAGGQQADVAWTHDATRPGYFWTWAPPQFVARREKRRAPREHKRLRL